MNAPNFLFINKDARSILRSDTHEKSLINSYVQQRRRHDRRVSHPEIELALRPTYQFRFRQLEKANHPDRSSSSQLESLQNFRRASSCLGTHEIDKRKGCQRDREQDWWLHFQWLDQQRLGSRICGQGDAIDPFSRCCVKLDQQTHMLLQYYETVSHPNVWYTESRAQPKKYTFRMDAVTVIRGCLASKVNLYTILASMASQMMFLEQASLQRDPSYYIHRALRATQEHINSSPNLDGRMVMNMFHLGCSEWYRYNHDAALVHLRAVKALADQLGGIQCLDKALMELILLGDGYLSAETLAVPVFPPDFDPGWNSAVSMWLSAEPGVELLRGCLGEGLLRTIQKGIVTNPLAEIVKDLVELVTVMKAYGRSVSTPPDTLHWVHLRNLAIRHRLLALTPEDSRTQVLRAAMLIWVLTTMTVSGRKRSIKVLAPKLQTLLCNVQDRMWNKHQELLTWVLSLGAMSAIPGTEVHRWFVDEIIWVSLQRLEIYADERVAELALVDLSERFFYLDGVQGPMIRALAKIISDGMRSRGQR